MTREAIPAGRGALARLGALVLTTDRLQRRCLSALLLSALVYAVCIGIVAFGSAQGLFDPAPARILAALMAAAPTGFYVFIRCGLNKRFAEPTLTFPQGLVAQTLVAGAYAITGPVHAANLMLFGLIMIFGMFDIQVRHARFLAGYTIAVAGGVMLWRHHTDPLHYGASEELIYFALMSTVLAAISQLSVLLSHMRRTLKSQKAELTQALAHIQEMATHDELTGLANRRHMLTLLGEHITRRARGGPGFAVALADIDHFKNVNDNHGHRVGDEALVTFAAQARLQLRSTDMIARWGGEEFLLLLPETVPPGDPNTGVERLRGAMAVAQASAQAPHLRIAFSTGLTRYIDGEAIDDMIERADGALYTAKSAGRNRTVAV